MPAVNLGIFTSTFARNEFQMVQFIPLIILPQVFLCGVLWPVEQMPDYLQWLSAILPLTYAVDGLRDIMLGGKSLIDVGSGLTLQDSHCLFPVGIHYIWYSSDFGTLPREGHNIAPADCVHVEVPCACH